MKYFINPNLSYSEYPNSYLLPFFDDCNGGLVDENGKFVKKSSCYEWNQNATLPDSGIIKYNRKVIFIGTMIPHWGHTYTDNLRKLWFLKTTECQRLI